MEISEIPVEIYESDESSEEADRVIAVDKV
jgi:hypothetical protein